MKNSMWSVAVTLSLISGGAQSNEELPSPDLDPKACPMVAYVPYHQINIAPKSPLTNNAAVILEGELKYDECLTEPSRRPAPKVTLTRKDGLLVLLVQHYGAYKVLPKDVSFEILDRGDCLGVPVSFFKVEKLPLEFKTNYPNTEVCAGVSTAHVGIIQ